MTYRTVDYETRFDTHRPLEALDWYLVWTNPRCEARAFAGIMARGVTVYRPMVCTQRRDYRSKKVREVRKGMFVRYLFVGLDRERGQGFADVRACDGVEGLVSFDAEGAPLGVPASDLRRVMVYDASGEAGRAKARGVSFAIGEKLRIIAGAFAGFDSKVTAYDARKAELETELSVFGRPTRVKLDVDSVRKRA